MFLSRNRKPGAPALRIYGEAKRCVWGPVLIAWRDLAPCEGSARRQRASWAKCVSSRQRGRQYQNTLTRRFPRELSRPGSHRPPGHMDFVVAGGPVTAALWQSPPRRPEPAARSLCHWDAGRRRRTLVSACRSHPPGRHSSPQTQRSPWRHTRVSRRLI